MRSFVRSVATVVLAPLLLVLALQAQSGDENWTAEDAETLQRAQAALRSERFEEALRELEALQPAHPRSGVLMRLYGHALAGTGRTVEARESLVRAVSLGELSTDVLARILEIDREAGREQAMLSAAHLLILLDPAEPAWLRLLADLHHANGENATAARLYQALAERDGLTGDVADRLGVLAFERGDRREAALYWETAFFLGDARNGKTKRLASLWLALGDRERSLEWSRREGVGDAPEDQVARAELLLSAGDALGARALLERTPDDWPGDLQARVRIVRGHCAERSGDAQQATQHFRAALDAGHASSDLALYVANRLRLEGDHAEAVRYLRLAAQGIGGRADVLELTVASLLETGELDDAEEFLARLIEEHGWSESAARLVRALAGRRRG